MRLPVLEGRVLTLLLHQSTNIWATMSSFFSRQVLTESSLLLQGTVETEVKIRTDSLDSLVHCAVFIKPSRVRKVDGSSLQGGHVSQC